MYAKIDKEGLLEFNRANKGFKKLECVYHESRNCGDWCAAFNEPHYHKVFNEINVDVIIIQTCKLTYEFHPAQFIDLRLDIELKEFKFGHNIGKFENPNINGKGLVAPDWIVEEIKKIKEQSQPYILTILQKNTESEV